MTSTEGRPRSPSESAGQARAGPPAQSRPEARPKTDTTPGLLRVAWIIDGKLTEGEGTKALSEALAAAAATTGAGHNGAVGGEATSRALGKGARGAGAGDGHTMRKAGADARGEPDGKPAAATGAGPTAGTGAWDTVGAGAKTGPAIWADLAGATADEVAEIARLLGLHPLIVEDILEGNQRAKIEVTDDRIHIVMFVLRYDDQIETSEVDIVLGNGFLLTVHGPDWDPWAVTDRRGGLAPVMARGPDHLLWALVDDIVDGYFPFIDRLGDAIEAVQDSVIARPAPETLEKLFDLKRHLLLVRRAATPVREIFNQLTNRELALIDADEILYFRDVYDHLIRLTDELDNYRELASGTLDVYLSTVNNQLSLIMKRLTGVTVVLTGIAAIAGIFGMSEAGTALGGGEAGGFWFVTVLTIAAALAMAWVLRRIGWI